MRAAVLLLAATSTFAADVTLSPDKQPTLQSVIDALPKNNPDWTRIYLNPGTYKQQLTVSRPHVAIIGLGSKPDDIIITNDLSAKSKKPDGTGEVGTTGSSSTYIKSPDFLASNVTFANSTPDNVAQAVAIKTQADRCIFLHCRFLGYQDTLYPTAGRDYFKDCTITGDTDFIFGNATAVFDHCTINSSDTGFVTAANTDPATPYGFVFLDCRLTCPDNVPAGKTYLGRPWQWDRDKNAAVAFLRCQLGPHISPAGWHPWDVAKNTDPASHTRYSEFGSTDLDGKPIDTSTRVPWSHQLTPDQAKSCTAESVLAGNDHWNPTTVINTVVTKKEGPTP